METDRLTREELIEREKAVIDKICSNDDYAYNFFHEQCRPLISKILWTIYGNNGDYDELVNELYLYLKKPNKEGEYWHNLKTFDYRTSLFDWINPNRSLENAKKLFLMTAIRKTALYMLDS